MPQTWKTSAPRATECETCRSSYEVTVTRLPIKDRDNYVCGVCGHEMDSWASTEVPSYRLIEAKPWPPKAP